MFSLFASRLARAGALLMVVLTISSADGQQPGFSPGIVAPNPLFSSSGDPYAQVGVASPIPWFGTGTLVPPRLNVANRIWARAEYLRWWTEGMDVPALVTSSAAGTLQGQAGQLGQSTTAILFGNREINDDAVNGIRAKAGFWLTQNGAFGIEGEYFTIEDQDDGFFGASDASTILARPFFDIVGGTQSARLIGFPGVTSGSVSVQSETQLQSFLINGRAALVPVHGPGCADLGGKSDRIDWIVGYRYLELEDRLTISDSRQTIPVAVPTTSISSERFETSNEFNGLQLGFAYQAYFRRLWLESLLRVAIGSNEQRVSISGGSTVTTAAASTDFTGGLLAQSSNIGTFQRDQFTMVPEAGLTLGVRVTDWLHATIGYSVIYFPSVVRAGDQIDTDINPNLVPPAAAPVVGPLRPSFGFVESDYWAHGINLGGEIRY